ncbi:MAG: hypothetical protein ACK50Y_02945 [Flavobacteriia bacterium]
MKNHSIAFEVSHEIAKMSMISFGSLSIFTRFIPFEKNFLFWHLQSTTKAQGQVLFTWCIKAQIEKKPLSFYASEEEMLTIKRSL